MMREIIVPGWKSDKLAPNKKPRPVLVLDPLGQPWNATQQTRDPYEFLEMMQRSRGCVGIWDECGYMMEENPKLKRDLSYLATVSRNDGHIMYFLSQRFYLVPPTFRLQCTYAYLFRLRGRDAIEAVDLFPEPGLELALPALAVGECIVLKPFQKAVKTRVF